MGHGAGKPELSPVFVFNPMLTPAEFLELVLHNFGLKNLPENKAQRLLRFEQFLADTHRQGRTPVLIVDEAHKVSHEVFEEIRLLTNYETGDEKLLQIMLAGQPEINEVLNRPNLWQLKQRVAVRLRIEPLKLRTSSRLRQLPLGPLRQHSAAFR